MFELARADGFVISDDRSRLDIERIVRWLESSYWATGRTRAAVERSVENSATYGLYDPAGAQVALTRAVTDSATFCWIGDVFVDESVRGSGLGSWLVGTVLDHQRSLGVPRFLLGTRDAHQVYERLGFEPLRVPSVYLELDERTTRPTADDVRVHRRDQPA
ncbi:MAG: histone acetyltransferase and related acetyltransferase [Pseudonocardiales bacterium]|nr:histone acetyltransferase and related acetyltransferase [Pseudonocardiales bacterium]